MLGAEEKLEKLSEQFKTCGMDREAREYEEIFGLVTELFEKFKSLLGTNMRPEESTRRSSPPIFQNFLSG